MVSLNEAKFYMLIDRFKTVPINEKNLGRRKFITLLAQDLNIDGSPTGYRFILKVFKESQSLKEQAVLFHYGRRFGVPEFQFEDKRPKRSGAKK